MQQTDMGSNALNGRYKLMEKVGSGGMAAVYKAEDMVLGRVVAVKILHHGLSGDAEFLHRFLKEAHAAANLSHPNIVTVHDVGQDNNRHYIVMELVEGRTLKQLIRDLNKTDETMPINRALDLAIQICSGVGYAHRAALVHCDVKPHNMLVTSDERVKVADFGIARAMSDVSLVRSDVIWGTPQYFSPEQAAGKTPTPASDVYSIGIILFEMLTGRIPFKAESHTALALKHIREVPPNVTSINPAVPYQLEQILNKILSKEPAARYRTAGQLGRILASYRERSHEETGAFQATPEGTTNYYTPEHNRKQPVTDISGSKKQPKADKQTQNKAVSTDWGILALGLLAFFAILGLIPLWYAVFLAYQ